MEKKKLKITYNSPVILTFALISLIVLIANYLTAGITNRLFFTTYYDSFLNPMFYVRLFTHVLGHSGFSHFAGNMLMFLLLGPLLEERYKSTKLLFMIMVTALTTGLINAIFFPHTALIGASGIVFMFILLASLSSFKEGEIPITFIIILVLYLGQEIVNGIFVNDNVSQMGHIIGGICGSALGFFDKNYK